MLLHDYNHYFMVFLITLLVITIDLTYNNTIKFIIFVVIHIINNTKLKPICPGMQKIKMVTDFFILVKK